MRPAINFRLHLSPPVSSSSPTPQPKCNAHTCPWWPYSNSKDFKANTAMILVILFSVLICVLAFNAAIRYLMRRRHPHQPPEIQGAEVQETQPHPAHDSAVKHVIPPPTFVFSAGIKLAGAEAECAICLSEFVEGEGIQVLGKCNHGFHVQCIQKWLGSNSSCPTCRASCFTLSSSDEIIGFRPENGVECNIPPAATVSQRGLDLSTH